jgi:molybdenum cofactor sulfurtransferase
MVCINQDTAEKSEEPFVTLSKTRRFDGKVFFGTHMAHAPSSSACGRDTQYPTIEVGDLVQPDVEEEL